jgi:hypothetical protein
MCEADARAGVDAEEPLDAEAKRTDYLMEHVTNSDGIYLLTLYRVSDPRKQAELLQLLATLRAIPAPPVATERAAD